MCARRRKRFLKNTAEYFYVGEDLILAVPYMNAAGAASSLTQSHSSNHGIIGTLQRMAEMAQGHEPRSREEQDRLDAMGSSRGQTGFPPVAGWVAFTKGRLLVFHGNTRLAWPSELAAEYPIKRVADITVRQLTHGNVEATVMLVDGSSARLNVRQDGASIGPAFRAAKGLVG
ncbi:MAG: hypothetical protein GY720_05325 [bacterium]|nr:hypothetical protein [bacterium]